MKKITFCINTSRNEKQYVELLLQSLLNGIDVNLHDILIFVDSDNQNTTEFLIEQKQLFPNLTIIKNNGDPVGYAGNINYMFLKAKTDIVSYLQSDMIVSLNYDKALLSHLKDDMILCSTRVEPPLHSQFDNEVTYVRDFGIVPDKFDYESFLKFAESVKNSEKITNYFFAPFTLYKKLWNEIGGHDTAFKKSREDSDVALRLVMNGNQLLQCWNALVYHFTCTSSRGIGWHLPENQTRDIARKENDKIELDRFINKWGTFVHPSLYSDVAHLNLNKNKIICNSNPTIDESNFTIL